MKASPVFSRVRELFRPRERNDRWQVTFGGTDSSGYDFALVVENAETEISYTLEFGIAPDGRLVGQITPDQGHNGPDALLVFVAAADVVEVFDDNGLRRLALRARRVDDGPQQGFN